MKRLLLFLLVFPMFGSAQEWEWAKKTDKTGHKSKILTVGDDFFILETRKFKEEPYQSFLGKYNESGNLVWEKELFFTAVNCFLDKNKNFILAGYFDHSFEMDGEVTKNKGGRDIIVFKLDFEGNLIWKIAEGTESNEFITTFTVDENNEIHCFITHETTLKISGETIQAKGLQNLLFLKISETGEVKKAKSLGYSIGYSNSDNISKLEAKAMAVKDQDYFVSFSAVGQFVFGKDTLGNGSDYGKHFFWTFNDSGSYLMDSWYYNVINAEFLDSGELIISKIAFSQYGHESSIERRSFHLEKRWETRVEGKANIRIPFHIYEEEIIFAIEFGIYGIPYRSDAIQLYPKGECDIAFLRMDLNGNLLNSITQFGGKGYDQITSFSINNDKITCAGNFSRTIEFGNLEIKSDSSNFVTYNYIARYGIGEVYTSIYENNKNSKLSVFPNPVKNIITISNTSLIRKIKIRDFYGKELETHSFSDNLISLDFSSFSSGLYFLEIQTEEGRQIKKIVVE